MNITNQEKQILQKYYAEQIKSRSSNLKDIIQRDDQTVLERVLDSIKIDLDEVKQMVLDTMIDQIIEKWREDAQATTL